MRNLLLAIVLATLSTNGLLARESPDWPQYRGATLNGTYPAAPANFDLKAAKLAWKTNVGTGVSSFAIEGDRVYTMGNVNNQDVLYCFNVRDGSVIWKKAYDCPLGARAFEGGPASTPALDEKHVYTISYIGQMHAWNKDDGTLAWKKHLKNDFGGRAGRWGYASSPIVHNGRIIIEPGGRNGNALVALNPTDGSVVWSGGDRPAAYSTPLPFSHQERSYIAVFNAYGLALHNEQGKVLAEYPWKTDYEVNAAMPVFAADQLLISSGYGSGSVMLKVDGENVRELHKQRDFACQMPTPVYYDGHYYGFSGDHVNRRRHVNLMCVSATDGQIKWSKGGMGMGNVILVGDRLVVQTMDGEVIIASPSPEGFKPESTRKVLGDRNWASPAFANNRLYLRNNTGDVAVLAWE